MTVPAYGAWEQSARLSFRFIMLGVAVLAVGWLFSNVRQVPSDSRAVVLRFGDMQREEGPGLLLALPRPFEEVVIVPSLDSQIALRIEPYEQPFASGGYDRYYDERVRSLAANSLMFDGFGIGTDPRANGAFLLTGDFSVVHLEATLFYQITNPRGYVLAGYFLNPALTRLYNASAIAVAANRDLDAILVARPEAAGQGIARNDRERFRADLTAAMNRRLEALAGAGTDLGVRIARVDLSPSIPSGAKAAFDYVLVAAQRAEETIANARTNAELLSQTTEQKVDEIGIHAETEAQERVNEAARRTAAVASLAAGPASAAPQVLRRRLYYERIKAILAKAARIDAVDREGGGRVILPGGAAQ